MIIQGMDDCLREGRTGIRTKKKLRKIEVEKKRKIEGKVELKMYLIACRDTAAEKKGR